MCTVYMGFLRYFIPDESGELYANPKDGRSLFAIEFDRLSGKVEGIFS